MNQLTINITPEMKERIIEFLSNENKTSAQFAEEIGVQASGVSHVLSGRNRPSLDFVLKMLKKYPYLSTDWLLFGKPPMYLQSSAPTLFDNMQSSDDSVKVESDEESEQSTNIGKPTVEVDRIKDSNTETFNSHDSKACVPSDLKVVKIMLLYSDNRFEEFSPKS